MGNRDEVRTNEQMGKRVQRASTSECDDNECKCECRNDNGNEWDDNDKFNVRIRPLTGKQAAHNRGRRWRPRTGRGRHAPPDDNNKATQGRQRRERAEAVSERNRTRPLANHPSCRADWGAAAKGHRWRRELVSLERHPASHPGKEPAPS